MNPKKDERVAVGDDPHATSRRERQTLIPEFDPEDLARAVEEADARVTLTPPFDPSAYARIVDAHVDKAALRDTPRAMAAARPTPVEIVLHPDADDFASVTLDPETTDAQTVETMGRAMYASYLQSDFPEALVLAERVLAQQPQHGLALLVAERCRAVMVPPQRLQPSSVVRLCAPKLIDGLRLDATSSVVLGHVDGVATAEALAELAGIPRTEALDRLHALLDLGIVEVVSF